MRNRLGAAMVLAGLFSTSAAADEEVVWKQVLNVPKGANLAPGTTWDVLGISPGDSYADVRPRLDALLAESMPKAAPKDKATATMLGQDTSGPLEENKVSIYLPVPGGKNIKATYVQRVELKRELKGSGARPIYDKLTLMFSTPASGNQVLSIVRGIDYVEHTDQVRIGEMIKTVVTKYGKAASVTRYENSTDVKLNFDNGKVFIPANILEECHSWMPMDINKIDDINPTGRCDVVLKITFGHGISDDHASSISFHIDDYARGKENTTADRQYFDAYLDNVRSRTAGQAPKL